jgi:hypothetical protein
MGSIPGSDTWSGVRACDFAGFHVNAMGLLQLEWRGGTASWDLIQMSGSFALRPFYT